MLSNFWVLILLFGQGLNVILFVSVLPTVILALRKWSAEASDLQLTLERKIYLIDFIIQLSLVFQILLFFVFFHLVNSYLPQIISGAMCAEGVLTLNQYGYSSLYVKLALILTIPILLIINKLDLHTPYTIFTPRKYYFFLLVLILMLLDFWWSFSFISLIQPNIITTCCSLSFLNDSLSGSYSNINQTLLEIAKLIFVVLGVLLGGYSLKYVSKKNVMLYVVLAFLFIFSGLYALKYYFIKFIYGLPNHYCVFDLFLAKYYYLGYGLFLGYFMIYYNMLKLLLYKLNDKKIHLSDFYYRKFARANLIFILIIWLIPLIYYFTWQGTL